MAFLEDVATGVGDLLDRARDRTFAIRLGAGAVAVIGGLWYLAVDSPDVVRAVFGWYIGRGIAPIVWLLFLIAAIGAPFVLMQSALALLSSPSRPSETHQPHLGSVDTDDEPHRRWRVASAIFGVLNVATLYVVTH